MSSLWHNEKIRERYDAAVVAYQEENNGQITSEKRSSILQNARDEVFKNLTEEERTLLKKEHNKRLEARKVTHKGDSKLR